MSAEADLAILKGVQGNNVHANYMHSEKEGICFLNKKFRIISIEAIKHEQMISSIKKVVDSPNLPWI